MYPSTKQTHASPSGAILPENHHFPRTEGQRPYLTSPEESEGSSFRMNTLEAERCAVEEHTSEICQTLGKRPTEPRLIHLETDEPRVVPLTPPFAEVGTSSSTLGRSGDTSDSADRETRSQVELAPFRCPAETFDSAGHEPRLQVELVTQRDEKDAPKRNPLYQRSDDSKGYANQIAPSVGSTNGTPNRRTLGVNSVNTSDQGSKGSPKIGAPRSAQHSKGVCPVQTLSNNWSKKAPTSSTCTKEVCLADPLGNEVNEVAEGIGSAIGHLRHAKAFLGLKDVEHALALLECDQEECRKLGILPRGYYGELCDFEEFFATQEMLEKIRNDPDWGLLDEPGDDERHQVRSMMTNVMEGLLEAFGYEENSLSPRMRLRLMAAYRTELRQLLSELMELMGLGEVA